MVVGISALRPPDKVAPHLRLRGPSTGRNDDGSMTVEVDFFADVPTSVIEQFLTANAKAFVHQYDNTYWVTLASWPDLCRLAIQDIVDWIDELPDEDKDRTENARILTGAEIVNNTYGYDGTGIVLSMTESNIVYPADHPQVGRKRTRVVCAYRITGGDLVDTPPKLTYVSRASIILSSTLYLFVLC